MGNKTTAMGNRTTFLQYAPYVYLARPEGQRLYYLFVAIRKRINEEVAAVLNHEGQVVSYQAGFTAINLSVSLKENPSGEEADDFFLMRYELNPEGNYPSGFDPESGIEVKVTTMEEGDEAEQNVYINVTPYIDADARPLPEGHTDSEPAFNCPYIFLEREAPAEGAEEEDGHAPGLYYPYVLIAPKGYRLAGPKDKILVTSPDNGVFESLLVLSKSNDILGDDRFAPFVNPAELKVNTESYSDSGQAGGNFAATAVCLESEAEAESLRSLEPMEIHRFLLEMEQAQIHGWPPEEELPAGPIAPGATLRRAKTRNMSSRRKHSRSIDISPIA